MARYIIQEASKWYTDERKPKYTIKFKDEEKTLTNSSIRSQIMIPLNILASAKKRESFFNNRWRSQ